jgi:soluble lytic murein transglycosylase-like protein
MQAESRGRTVALSSKGAMGLMQLMPGTWAEMRASLGLGADPFDPRDNVLAGTYYLRLLYERFGYPGLFAAYNAGPRRYADALAGRRTLPLETRAYVASVAGPKPTLFAISASSPKPAEARVSRAKASLFFPLSAGAAGQ